MHRPLRVQARLGRARQALLSAPESEAASASSRSLLARLACSLSEPQSPLPKQAGPSDTSILPSLCLLEGLAHSLQESVFAA